MNLTTKSLFSRPLWRSETANKCKRGGCEFNALLEEFCKLFNFPRSSSRSVMLSSATQHTMARKLDDNRERSVWTCKKTINLPYFTGKQRENLFIIFIKVSKTTVDKVLNWPDSVNETGPQYVQLVSSFLRIILVSVCLGVLFYISACNSMGHKVVECKVK